MAVVQAQSIRTFHCNTVDSTSDEARRLLAIHPGQPFIVSADEQTAGRGRSGRKWQSPQGGAWFTLAWPVRNSIDEYKPAPVLAGLAVLRVLKEMLDQERCVELKWPNDILLDGKKIAGVLCELIPHTSQSSSIPATLIAGVGINANFEASLLDGQSRYPATTLFTTIGRDTDLPSLVSRCSDEIATLIALLENQGITPDIQHELNTRLAWKEQRVSIQIGSRRVHGICKELDQAGQLVLGVDEKTEVFDSGEIEKMTLLHSESPE